jgi:hypothetical protein
MSSIRSIFGTILNRSAHDAYRARYLLQQQWRSITDATLQQCAERRIALIKENSQVKKNNFSKKIAQTGSRHTAEESADDSPVRKIIFSSKKRQNWESIHRKEFAEISRTRKHGKIRKKEKKSTKNKLPQASNYGHAQRTVKPAPTMHTSFKRNRHQDLP